MELNQKRNIIYDYHTKLDNQNSHIGQVYTQYIQEMKALDSFSKPDSELYKKDLEAIKKANNQLISLNNASIISVLFNKTKLIEEWQSIKSELATYKVKIYATILKVPSEARKIHKECHETLANLHASTTLINKLEKYHEQEQKKIVENHNKLLLPLININIEMEFKSENIIFYICALLLAMLGAIFIIKINNSELQSNN